MKQVFMGLSLALSLAIGTGCGGSSSTSGGGGPAGGVNGCTSFADATPPSASRTIRFGDSLGNNYDPKCLAISAGQTVTFTGSFTAHPLLQGVGPTHTGGDPSSPNNPVPSVSSGNTVQVTFPVVGTYGYYCSTHETEGMIGAIKVK